VAGEGPYSAPGLEWLGPRDDVPALLAEADVLAVPSRWEGFGIAALEGMAAGVPVVASDVGGLAELVGDAGVLVPPGNPRALRDALDRVLRDRDLARDLSRRGRERARRYGMERMVGSYVDIWEGVRL
ncbi:MAG: glycosyltransferase, partial [Deltaproteobacteria bacterium]|nr:glycosyltransferase [Deltaproteobacteria bacterium]